VGNQSRTGFIIDIKIIKKELIKMNKSIPFEVFGPNQFIKFDIVRISDLEAKLGKPILRAIAEEDISFNFILKGLMVGMQQHYRPVSKFYSDKIEEHLMNGGTVEELAQPLLKAIMASGIMGKKMADVALGIVEPEEEQTGDEELKNAPKRKRKTTE
jgi:hypothetical protein